MTGLSIRWKLTLWYGGVLAVILVLFSAAVYLTLRHQLLERIDQGLAEELADVLYEVKRANDPPSLHEWLDRRFGRHEGFDFQITRPDADVSRNMYALLAATKVLLQKPALLTPRAAKLIFRSSASAPRSFTEYLVIVGSSPSATSTDPSCAQTSPQPGSSNARL